MALIEASAGGGEWSSTGSWVGAKVPGAGDDVELGNGSGSITVAANAECRSLRTSLAYGKTFKINTAITLKVGAATANAANSVWQWQSGTLTFTGSAVVSLVSTAGTTQAFSPGTVNYGKVTFAGSATYQLEGSVKEATVTLEATATLNVNVNQAWAEFIGGGVETARTLNIEGLTITLSAVGGWKVVKGKGLTLKASGSIIELTKAKANFRSTETATYATVVFTAAEPTIQGPTITIATLEFLNAPTTVTVVNNAVITVTTITTNSKSGSVLTIESSIAAKTFTFSKASGKVSLDYLSLKDCHAEGGAEFYAGAHSTLVSNDTGWKNEAPPSHEHTLEATQSSSATKSKEVGRTLTSTQGSGATKSVTVARALAITQGQAVTKATTPTRYLKISQEQAVLKAAAITRTLSVGQGQAVLKAAALARQFEAGQGQAVVRSETVARVLSVTQGSTITRGPSTVTRALEATQVASSALGKIVARTLAVEQAQEASKSAQLGRGFSTTQGQAVVRIIALERILVVGQQQEVESPRPGAKQMHFTVGQGQSASESATVSRSLAVTQTAAATIGRSPARTLSATGSQSASADATLTRVLAAVSTSTPRLAHSPNRTLTCGSHAVVSFRRQLARTLLAGVTQSATCVGEHVIVFTPAKIASSVTPDVALLSTTGDNIASGVEPKVLTESSVD